METCKTCRFWTPQGGLEVGECRRRAPLVTGGMMSSIETVWPEVAAIGWCGEHERPIAAAARSTLPSPHPGWLHVAERALGASRADCPGLWIVPGHPELTGWQLIDLYMSSTAETRSRPGADQA